jgi:hypothetical protein
MVPLATRRSPGSDAGSSTRIEATDSIGEGQIRSSGAGGRPNMRAQPPDFQRRRSSAVAGWTGTRRGRFVFVGPSVRPRVS